MKNKLKGIHPLLSSLFIIVLHLLSAFAKPVAGNRLTTKSVASASATPDDSLTLITNHFKSVYDSLHLDLAGLSQQAFEYARKGLEKLVEQGRLLNDSIISIVDFSQPSNMKRLYVLDVKNYKVLYHTLVAHGKNSGREWAHSFSNLHSSFKSSPGFYITGTAYNGSNGYSLKLEGIERGINDNAFERGIVIHGAGYVSQDLANAQGYIGRSEGCPAVPVTKATAIIKTIKEGTCLFIYHPGPSYVRHSTLLN